eukprot:scaffold973_cov399-Prasinococcus_capsulatus_cf.AAC.36
MLVPYARRLLRSRRSTSALPSRPRKYSRCRARRMSSGLLPHTSSWNSRSGIGCSSHIRTPAGASSASARSHTAAMSCSQPKRRARAQSSALLSSRSTCSGACTPRARARTPLPLSVATNQPARHRVRGAPPGARCRRHAASWSAGAEKRCTPRPRTARAAAAAAASAAAAAPPCGWRGRAGRREAGASAVRAGAACRPGPSCAAVPRSLAHAESARAGACAPAFVLRASPPPLGRQPSWQSRRGCARGATARGGGVRGAAGCGCCCC